jgi:hypothetical protein
MMSVSPVVGRPTIGDVRALGERRLPDEADGQKTTISRTAALISMPFRGGRNEVHHACPPAAPAARPEPDVRAQDQDDDEQMCDGLRTFRASRTRAPARRLIVRRAPQASCEIDDLPDW